MKRPRRGSRQGRQAMRAPRQRPLRRSQLITPFGIGAMNDFRHDEALMCAGLDMWFRGTEPPTELRIAEERLQARLGCEYFVKPPEYSDQEGAPRFKIPHVQFPRWHYCPRCFRMKSATIFGVQPRCMEASCSRAGHGRRMIPVRIVAVCGEGHIQDFPFREWIGCSCADEATCQLFFKAGRSAASLAGIKIECSACGKKRSLAGSFSQDGLSKINAVCLGAQPWLGRERGASACIAPLQTVQRGGSNVYFPLVSSSIYIPPATVQASDNVRRVLESPDIWRVISSGIVDGKANAMVVNALAQLNKVDPDELLSASQAKLDGISAMPVGRTEEEFRRQEYDVLRAGAGSPFDELFVEQIDGRNYGWLAPYVHEVGLVRKLRETRVHIGFSRLLPKTDRGEPGVQPLKISDDIRWLPAIEVRGEGIFIEFNEQAIRDWASREKVGARIRGMVADYNNRRVQRQLSPRAVDARFMMIHAFAHVLIKELTFSCGYGSASLRERLYCNLEDRGRPMNGLLVYTASGDSEGTLGGLVAQADPVRFVPLVLDGLRRASWCSNDPVCMESPGQGGVTSNLAACHGCVLLPETSCEEGNRLLDRGLLVGTIEDSKVGFFGDAPFRAGL